MSILDGLRSRARFGSTNTQSSAAGLLGGDIDIVLAKALVKVQAKSRDTFSNGPQLTKAKHNGENQGDDDDFWKI